MIIIITIINDLKHYKKKNKWKSYRKHGKWISISWKIMVMMIMMIIAVASQSPSSSNQLSHKTKPSSWSQNVHWSIVRYHADIFVFNLWSANEVYFIVCVCVHVDQILQNFKSNKNKADVNGKCKGIFSFFCRLMMIDDEFFFLFLFLCGFIYGHLSDIIIIMEICKTHEFYE